MNTFKNGDLVYYRWGLKFHFIAINYFNKTEAYCSRQGKAQLLTLSDLNLVKNS